MVTVKGEGGGCVCGVEQAERWGSVLWSCAIPAAHRASALLLHPARTCRSCCHPEGSQRPRREQMLNLNEAAEKKK